jgi:hypothetical protein
MPEPEPANPNPLDQAADQLRDRYPGWRVWHVRRAVDRGAWWSGQPARYPLIAGSPDELAALIDADQGDPGRPAGSSQ